MANLGLLPLRGNKSQGCQAFLTFIVPTTQCSLRCRFCFIRQRREALSTSLKPENYTKFIEEVARRLDIYGISVQGYEPLLPESETYTQVILSTAKALKVPSCLVTNGMDLRRCLPWLSELSPDSLAVSLDASCAEDHDRLRGAKGAWASAVDGAAAAVTALPATQVAIASVLIPGKTKYLEELPRLLKAIGITHWIVTPLYKVGATEPGGVAGDVRSLGRAFSRLEQLSDEFGIDLKLDDELGLISDKFEFYGHDVDKNKIRRVPTGVKLIRLSPDGDVAANEDILVRSGATGCKWRPAVEAAGEFSDRVLKTVLN